MNGTSLFLNNGALSGKFAEPGGIVQSASWLYTDTKPCSKITIKLKSSSYATRMRLSIVSRNIDANFWSKGTDPVDWTKEEWITVPRITSYNVCYTKLLRASMFRETIDNLIRVA